MPQELVIYTDESTKKGSRYSNFYGGLLVRSQDLDAIQQSLQNCIDENGFTSELKWTYINESVCERYCNIVDCLFGLISTDQIKVRVMFMQNRHRPTRLSQDQIQNTYWILYYQFLKHAFGLQFYSESESTSVRLLIDQMPGTKEQVRQFKDFIAGLNNRAPLADSSVRFHRSRMSEIDSSKHCIAQCLDIILGSMQFRLNNLHLAIPDGKRRRGKRTLAKERVYKRIQSHLKQLRPYFNIGESTGQDLDSSNRWNHSYRHWKFMPSEVREKNPAAATDRLR